MQLYRQVDFDIVGSSTSFRTVREICSLFSRRSRIEEEIRDDGSGAKIGSVLRRCHRFVFVFDLIFAFCVDAIDLYINVEEYTSRSCES